MAAGLSLPAAKSAPAAFLAWSTAIPTHLYFQCLRQSDTSLLRIRQRLSSSRDHNGQVLAFVYCEDEPGRRTTAKLLTRDEARRIAVNIAKLQELLRKD